MRLSIAQIQAAGGFDVIYADCPWRYDDSGVRGAAEPHYSSEGSADKRATMSTDQLCQMRVRELAAKDCALFMWGTYPLLPDMLQVINAWGFAYKTIAFQWVKFYEKSCKPFFGNGRWTRGNTEGCFLAVRGKPRTDVHNVSQLIVDYFEHEEILTAPVSKHSAKPAAARSKIELLTPAASRVELFARETFAGWDCYGNEVASTISLE